MVETLETCEEKGGFYPEYIMKKIIHNSYEKENAATPVFILLTSDQYKISILDGFSEMMFAFPELPFFYSINSINNVIKHDLESGKVLERLTSLEINPTAVIPVNWNNKTHYVIDNGNASYLFNQSSFNSKNKWEEGLSLSKFNRQYALNPEDTESWSEIVKKSIETNILSPFTAFISLENEAQKNALLKKQKEVLNAHEDFDLEEVEPMSEPSILWYILFLIGLIIYTKRPKLSREKPLFKL
jgi:hypothetical protein